MNSSCDSWSEIGSTTDGDEEENGGGGGGGDGTGDEEGTTTEISFVNTFFLFVDFSVLLLLRFSACFADELEFVFAVVVVVVAVVVVANVAAAAAFASALLSWYSLIRSGQPKFCSGSHVDSDLIGFVNC